MPDSMKTKIQRVLKNNAAADLGLPSRVQVCNLNPSNSCEANTNFREQVANLLPQEPTKVGNYRSRNQPSKLGDYRPGKWAMSLGFLVFLTFFISTSANALETAPRISDKEIVERLVKLEEGQKALEKRMDDKFDATNRRIDDLRSEMNSRFDTLQWMFGLFITISIVILGFVLRMQWQMMKRQTQMETSLETQKDELAFLKGLIEKLLPPKGAL